MLGLDGADLVPAALPVLLAIAGLIGVLVGVVVSHAVTRELGVAASALAALTYATRNPAGAFAWTIVAVPLLAALGEAARYAADRKSRNARVIVEADARRGALGASAIVVFGSFGAALLVWAVVSVSSQSDGDGTSLSGPGVTVPLSLAGLAAGVGAVAIAQQRLAIRAQALARPRRGIVLAVSGAFVLVAMLGLGAIADLGDWGGSNTNTNTGSAFERSDTAVSESIAAEPVPDAVDAPPEDGPLWVVFVLLGALLTLLIVLGRRETIVPPADLKPDPLVRLGGVDVAARPTLVETVDRSAAVSSLDEALVALDVGGDHAAAVRLAYATVADGFGRKELKRTAAETEGEYLARVLGDLGSQAPALDRLTALFSRARFSAESVDGTARDEARDALVAIRDAVGAPSRDELGRGRDPGRDR